MAPKKVRKGKKKWYPIVAPAVFDRQEIGETYIYETEQLSVKRMSINLMTLTGNPKKQNMNVFFVGNKVAEGKAHTRLHGIEMQPSSIKRLARRGRSKVADSFKARTKGGQVVIVKPVIMTRTKTDFATQRALRKRARALISEVINKHGFDSVVADITNNRLQRYLKDQLSTVFPVRSADIKYLRYVKPDAQEEGSVEQITYAERPKRPKEDAEGLASLKEEVETALLEDDEEDEPPKKRKGRKASEEPDDE